MVPPGQKIRADFPRFGLVPNANRFAERIECYTTMPSLKRGLRAFLDHPRARVHKEARGRWVPGWVLRYLYKPMVSSTEKDVSDAMKNKSNSTEPKLIVIFR